MAAGEIHVFRCDAQVATMNAAEISNSTGKTLDGGPITIFETGAYSGEALEKAGAIDITDIGATTPNTTLEVSRGSNSTLSAEKTAGKISLPPGSHNIASLL